MTEAYSIECVQTLRYATSDDWHNVVPSNIIILLRRESCREKRFTNAHQTSSLGFILLSSFRKFCRESWCRSWGRKIIGKHRGIKSTDDDTVQSRHYFIQPYTLPKLFWYIWFVFVIDWCAWKKYHTRKCRDMSAGAGRERYTYFLFFHFSCAKGIARNVIIENGNAIPYLSLENKVKLTLLFKHNS